MDKQKPEKLGISLGLEALHDCLMEYISSAKKGEAYRVASLPKLAVDRTTIPLFHLLQVLKLTSLEQWILLLCLGQEIDHRFASLCAEAQAKLAYPTINLVSNLFEQKDSVLKALTRLRYWQLIKVGNETNRQFNCSLSLTEWALYYILGQGEMEQWLKIFLQPLEVKQPSLNCEQESVHSIIKHWENKRHTHTIAIAQFISDDKAHHKQIAALVAKHYQVPVYGFNLMSLPNHCYDLDSYKRLLEREILLRQGIYLIDCDYLHRERLSDTNHIIHMLESLLKTIPKNCILSSTQPLQQLNIPLYPLYISKLAAADHLSLWQHALSESNLQIASNKLEQLSECFTLNRQQIEDIVYSTNNPKENDLDEQIWQHCRQKTRKPIADMAKWLEPKATWQDLVLAEPELTLLKDIVEQFANRHQVYQAWGFNAKNQGYFALAVLFCGASGTGKTLAAQVLAKQLQLDLLQVDLSKVVSKYIGETEKNLEQIFQAAEQSSALLLFDEADALFGKRLQVTDSKDRYANISTSYLLQRIETFKGLTILTTNFKQAFDQAFIRRFRFIVEFSAPGKLQRELLWQQAFPQAVPTQALDYDKLSELSLTGGQINLIALNAAFKAAALSNVIDMELILASAKQEMAKSGIPEAMLDTI